MRVDGRKGERPGGQVLSAVQDVGREEVARILSELVLGERCSQVVHELGLDEEQEDAADDLEQPVETFQQDADLEDPVEPGLGLEPVSGAHDPDVTSWSGLVALP